VSDSAVPIYVTNNVVALTAGDSHSLFVKSDGTLWGMGRNDNGQLGNGTWNDSLVPIYVANDVVAVAAGQWHSLYIKRDGTLWGMGYNMDGELGVYFAVRTKISCNLPVFIASNVVAITAGEMNSLFVLTDGTLWGMGFDNYNLLASTYVHEFYFHPIQIHGGGLLVASLAKGSLAYHALAISGAAPALAPLINRSIQIGQPAYFVATVTGGDGPFTYQWQFNGTNIMNATNATYTIDNVAPSNAGMYTVIVTGPYGSTSVSVIMCATFSFTITSDHGTANPAVGVYENNPSSILTNMVISPDQQANTLYSCVGWSMAGNEPASGITTQCVLTLTNSAVLTWNWQAQQYLLTTGTIGSGFLMGGGWYNVGDTAVLAATPTTNWHFNSWYGDTNGCVIAGNVITAVMTQVRNIGANFVGDPTTLSVSSAYGGTWSGLLTTNYGTALNEWITNAPVINGTTQYVCTGATVESNDFTQVSTTNVFLTLTNSANLTWNWQTLYMLATATNGSGNVTGGGWRAANSNTMLTAVANVGAYFVGWSGDTNGCVIAGNVLTTPMTQPGTITASFAMNQETLTVTSAQGGAAPGSIVVDYGTPISQWVTNSPVINGTTQYVCTGATVDSNDFTQVSTTNVFLTLTNSANLTLNWQTLYMLATATNGSGTVTTGGWCVAGSNVVLKATPATWWRFTGWSGDTNGCLIAGNVITASMTQARNLVATFVLDPHTLTVTSVWNGALPGSLTTNNGTTLSEWIINSPVFNGTTQYVCTAATVDSNAFTQVSSTNVTLTLTNDATLTWNWQTLYLLATATNGPGSVTAGGWLLSNSNVVLTATPGTHAHFVVWSGDTNGCTIAGNMLTAPMTQARAITAVFAFDQKTLTVISAQGGTSPGTTVADYGSPISQWVTNSPLFNGATQYVCTGGTAVSNDFIQVSPTNVTLNLTNNATLTWSWQTQYLLTTGTNGLGSVTAGGWYINGSNVVLIATPGANERLLGWFGDTNGCQIAGNTLTAPMTQARAISACFVPQPTLTVISAYGGANPGSGIVGYGSNSTQQVVNSPVSGGAGIQYVCTGGTVSGNAFTQVSPTNVTLTVTNSATLTWNWQTQYLLITGTNGPGSVTPGGWRAAGSNAVVVATPGTHEHVAVWTGDTNDCTISGNTLTAPMTQPRTITAVFTWNTETLTIASTHGTGTPSFGVYTNLYNALLSNSISAVDQQGATQYVCTGWTMAGNVATGCGATTNQSMTLMTQSYENNGNVPDGWAIETVSGGNSISFVTGTTYPGGFTAYDGSYLAKFNSFSVNGGVTRLKMTTPVSTIACTNVTVDFAWLESSAYPTASDRVEVEWSTDGATWTTAGTFNRYNAVQGWKIKNCALPAGANGQVALYMAFQFTSADGDDCYLDFAHLTAFGTPAATAGTGTAILMVHTNDAILTWNWQTQVLLRTATNGPGRVTPGGWCVVGSNAVLTAVAASNAHFTGWGGDTNDCGIAGNALTAPMTQARAITASFAVTTNKTLTVISDHGGTLPGTIGAYAGTAINTWVTNSPMVNGATQFVCTGAIVKGNAFTLVSPTNVTLTLTNNATLTWRWSTNYWLHTATSGNGSVNLSDVWWLKGSNAQIIATAGDHALFGSWSGQTSGCTIKSNVITAPMTSPRAITANFARAIVVTAIANPPAGGTVTGGGAYLASANTIALVAKGNTGWRFTGWSDGTTAATHATLKNLAGDTNYTANFIQLGTVTAKANPTTGGTVTGGGTYDVGTNITLVAKPTSSWLFTQWENSTTNANRQITVAAGSVTCTATFVQGRILTVTASPANGGRVTGGGTYAPNATATLTATPNNNWRFVKWSDGNTNTLRTLIVSNAATYTGQFVVRTGVISLGTNALAFGSVPIGQSASQTVAIANLGPNALKVTSIGVPAGYTATPTVFTLASNGMTNVTVVFKPTVVGAKTGIVSLVSNAEPGATNIAVTGAGIAATRIVRFSGDLNFGAVLLRTTNNLPLALANDGNSPLSVTALAFGAGGTAFKLPGLKVPFTVAAGGSTNLTVTYTPTAVGTNRATLTATVTSMTSGSTNTLTATGIAFAAMPLAVKATAFAASIGAGSGALVVRVVGLTLPPHVPANWELASVIVAGGKAQVVPTVLAADGTACAIALECYGTDTNHDGIPDAVAAALGDRLKEGVKLLTIQYAEGTINATTPFADILVVEGIPMPLDALPASWQLVPAGK
jgi:hypothetical protein